jgi:transcriptional regulator with XRE-family HTH domain
MDAMQCRMARAALKWSSTELADRASVGEATVARFERGSKATSSTIISAIQRALEAVGVEFIERGVRLRETSAKASDLTPGE